MTRMLDESLNMVFEIEALYLHSSVFKKVEVSYESGELRGDIDPTNARRAAHRWVKNFQNRHRNGLQYLSNAMEESKGWTS